MTFVRPKTYGRMGNFLFQAACAMSYAWRHNLAFTLPDKTNDPASNPIYLQHLVDKRWNERLPTIVIKEKTHAFHEIPFQEEWRNKNIVLDGYWQSEKYFKEWREKLLKTFGFPWKQWEGHVSVHVRRGDYLTLTKKHPPVPKEWIDKAMDRFAGFHYVFFSDDREWCRQNYGHREDCAISEGKNEVDDLIMMSWCEHHICSASTFSWWGAWMNRNIRKKVIIPKHWFQPGYRGLQTDDIVPMEWEKV